MDMDTNVSNNDNGQQESLDSHVEGPNIIVMSDAAKPIFSRWGNEEDLSTACSLIQAIRASALDDPSLGHGDICAIKSKRSKFVFLSVGALTIVSISSIGPNGDCETDVFLRMQLEYIYGQIIFTLTNHVQNIFAHSPNFDLRNMLGATDNDIRNILDQTGPLGNEGPFLTAGVEAFAPLPFQIRHGASRIITSICDKLDLLFAILIVKTKIVTIVQPKNPIHQLHTSDLHLLLNFVSCQGDRLESELWFPVCLPRFNSSGFVYAYHSCLDTDETKLRLILMSQENSTEQFRLLRDAALDVRRELGFEPIQSPVIRIYDSTTSDERKSSVADTESEHKLGDVKWNWDNSKIYSKESEEQEKHTEDDENDNLAKSIKKKWFKRQNTERNSNIVTKMKEKGYSLKAAIKEAINPEMQKSMIKSYCDVATALHFIFRYNVPIRHHKTGEETGGMLSQCLSPPLESPFLDYISKRRVWNMYQRLSSRLRLGSSSMGVTMDAFDMISGNRVEGSNDISYLCPAQGLLEAPAYVHGVTYALDQNELFIGLNGKYFELYATLPNTIPPKDGAALCARLVRRLMNDESDIFVVCPLSWRF